MKGNLFQSAGKVNFFCMQFVDDIYGKLVSNWCFYGEPVLCNQLFGKPSHGGTDIDGRFTLLELWREPPPPVISGDQPADAIHEVALLLGMIARKCRHFAKESDDGSHIGL